MGTAVYSGNLDPAYSTSPTSRPVLVSYPWKSNTGKLVAGIHLATQTNPVSA